MMKMPKVGGAGKFKAPKISAGPKPMKIHPAAQARIRLPQGMDNTGSADPPPWLPGVGKI
jgi:hypothetical protein